MRALICAFSLGALLTFSLVLPGCSRGGDEMLEYDPEVSEKKRVEYQEQMRKAMEGAKKGPQRPGGKR